MEKRSPENQERGSSGLISMAVRAAVILLALTSCSKNEEPQAEVGKPKLTISMRDLDESIRAQMLKTAGQMVQVLPSGHKLIMVVGDELKDLTGGEYCADYDFTTPEGREKINSECQFYDPRVSTTPLVKILEADLMANADKKGHFKVNGFFRIDPSDNEVANSDAFKKLTQPCNPYDEKNTDLCWKYGRVDNKLINSLSQTREKVGKDMGLDECSRGYAFNIMMSVAGQCKDVEQGELKKCIADRSFHASGRACDVNRFDGLAKAMDELFPNSHGVRDYHETIVHLDIRKKKHRKGL